MQIGDYFSAKESGTFMSMDTGKTYKVAEEMSDQKQGAWADGPHPYSDDPMVVTADAFILEADPFEDIVFSNTNMPVKAVAWQNLSGEWFSIPVEYLETV